MNAEIAKYLKPLVPHEDPEVSLNNISALQILNILTWNGKVIRGLCTVVRFLILDDDVRVEFGKAHDHAKALATEFLQELNDLLPSMLI